MRETIGGTWIINIVLIFMVITISYLGISLNYTRAFRVKNHIVNVLEETGNKQETLTKLRNDNTGEGNFWSRTGYEETAIVIEESPSSNAIGFAKACKFNVSVPLDIIIPVINYKIPINVTGETRTIYNANGNCGF